ncbi:MAG TPA: signal peptidase II [Acidobacteriota bacterium]|nr:signal peptidase II [Acidobacteriota bacterium]
MKNKYYLITLLVLAVDHFTKWIVRTNMNIRDAIDIVPSYLRISYVQNSGVAFGLFADIQSAWKPYILAAMAVVAVIVILIYSSRMPLNRTLLQLALAVTMGGILGNFTDRIMHGFVVDFVEFHVHESFHWPTFNVADSAITIGIALLLIDTVKNPEMEEEPQIKQES